MRTEHGQTPNQLFISGSLQLQNAGLVALDFFHEVPETYIIDYGYSIPSDEDDRVEVPETNLDISDDQMAQLHSEIDPLSESHEFGVDLFLQILELLRTFV